MKYKTKMNDSNENDIDLNVIFRIFLRNKLFISTITTSATLLTIVFSLIQTPIYKGNFKILVKKGESQEMKTLNSSKNIQSFLSGENTDDKTQEYILKSASVLKPVFNRAIEEYSKRGDTSQKRYEMWVEKTLNIGFEKDTKVLKNQFDQVE